MYKGTEEGRGSGERNMTACEVWRDVGSDRKPEKLALTYSTGKAAGANDHILGGFKKKPESYSLSSVARLLTCRCQRAALSEGSRQASFLASSGFWRLSAFLGADLRSSSLCLHLHTAFLSACLHVLSSYKD